MQKFNDYIKINEAVNTKKFFWKRNKVGGIDLKQGNKIEGYISVTEDKKNFMAVRAGVGKEFSTLDKAKQYLIDSVLSFYHMTDSEYETTVENDDIKPIFWRDFLNDH